MLNLQLLETMSEVLEKLMIIYMDHSISDFYIFRIKSYSLTRGLLSLTTCNVILRMQKFER